MMQPLPILALMSFAAASAAAQSEMKMQRKKPAASTPECVRGAVCFSGEVREGETFRRDINDKLEFVIGLPGGFRVGVKGVDEDCRKFSWVADTPFRAHRQTEIDAQYDWTAEQEVETSPREFRFGTNCAAYRALYDLLQTDAGKFVDNLPVLANGEGRLWITASRVTHSHGLNGKEQGAVEWIKFSVEIKLPKAE
jgi:hypothetical protein